jgi:hypothetical protein
MKLIFAEHYDRIFDASAAERWINGRSRAEKKAYIGRDFCALAAFGKRGRQRSY